MNNWNGAEDSILEVVVMRDNNLAKTWIKSFECSPNNWRKNIPVFFLIGKALKMKTKLILSSFRKKKECLCAMFAEESALS